MGGRIGIGTRTSTEPRELEARSAILQELAAEHEDDARRLRWTLGVAAVAHAVLLFVTMPDLGPAPKQVPPSMQKVYVVEQVRFQLPPPRPQQARPKTLAKRIPIPDPTPDDPEPIVRDHFPVTEIDLSDALDLDFGIPEAPEGVGALEGWGEALGVGGNVLAPVKVYAPQPSYTEEARQARVQGTVILRTIIDESGDVVAVEVLKGLTLGLTESAAETVRTWTYKPATRNGVAVPVYMFVMVNFRLT